MKKRNKITDKWILKHIGKPSRFEKEIYKQHKILHKWMLRNVGKRCSIYESQCPVCKAWKGYDLMDLTPLYLLHSYSYPEKKMYKIREKLPLKNHEKTIN